MVSSIPVAALVVSFVGSLAILAVMVHLAPTLGIVAQPNERSSHKAVTPTMGGVGIVIPVLLFLAVAALEGDRFMTGLLLSGGLLAIIGFADDLRELSALVRFCCQGLAVVIVLFALELHLPWLVISLIGFLLLWHINLYNFMDGIDGIAAVQALVFCLGSQLVAGGIDGNPGILSWVITGATLGFLAFNWPPAKIFMGDVGALVLGLVLACLVIAYQQSGQVPYVASLVLLSGFWFDASYTLCVRMVTGQKFTQAHRSHLYQRMSDVLGHRGTTLLFGGFGACWLLPLAFLSLEYPGWGVAILGLSTLPYLIGAVYLKAGQVATATP